MKSENVFRFNWIDLRDEGEDLAKINKTSICSEIVLLLELMTGIRNNKFSKKEYHASLRLLASMTKPNFLLNVETILEYNTTVENKCLLFYLAGKRNFADYKLKGISSIPLKLVENQLEFYDFGNNPFLHVEGNTINFKLK